MLYNFFMVIGNVISLFFLRRLQKTLKTISNLQTKIHKLTFKRTIIIERQLWLTYYTVIQVGSIQTLLISM